MDNIKIAAISKNEKYVVLQKGHLYGVYKEGTNMDEVHWGGRSVLASALMKAGFKKYHSDDQDEQDTVEKSRKSVGRIDKTSREKEKSPREKLLLQLGLGNFSSILKSQRGIVAGIVGYSVMEFDKILAQNAVDYILDDLPTGSVIVTGATKIGIPAMIVASAKKRGIKSIGIMPQEGYETGLSKVDELVVEGDKWGDESARFIDMIDILYAVGGGRQATKEVLMAEAKGIEVKSMELLPADQYPVHKGLGPKLLLDLSKAGTVHIPKGAERFSYTPSSERGVIYIPVNRLKQIYQTDGATNWDKVDVLVDKMKNHKPIDPVQVGYNYDVQDGHHRWEAAKKLGYSHVPCEIVGTDKEKVAEAKKKYRKVWKSFVADLEKAVVTMEIRDPDGELQRLLETIRSVANSGHSFDVVVDPDIKECTQKFFIDGDGACHIRSLKVKEDTKKSESLVIDLIKGGALNRGKLVKRMVPIKGKGGKTFYAHRWVDPTEDVPEGSRAPKQDESTYRHSTDVIKPMEKKYSNRFPVMHHPVMNLKIKSPFYYPDKEKIDKATEDYHNGKELPPIVVNDRSEITGNHHIYEMAQKLGLSHVPVVVTGNPTLKKELESRLRQAPEEDVEGPDGEHTTRPINQEPEEESDPKSTPSALPIVKGYEQVADVNAFRNVLVRKYPKSYLMEQAKNEGISWEVYTNEGERLPENSPILWKNAHMAIAKYIENGGVFRVKHDSKEIDRRMTQDGKNPLHRYFLEVVQKFGGDKELCMDWCEKNGIHWQQKRDPYINWKNCAEAIQAVLGTGKMVNGVRIRSKGLIEESQVVISPQVKDMVAAYGKKYSKANVMNRMAELGITYDTSRKDGGVLEANSPILWMRAATALQRHLAKGEAFSMSDKSEPNGIIATAGKDKDTGDVELSRWQNYAVDMGARNSQEMEGPNKEWAMKALAADRGISGPEAEDMYKKFMENARKAKVMIHFDPLEKLDSGVNLADQLSSDGTMKNSYTSTTGLDEDGNEEEQHANWLSDRYMFGNDYDPNDEERPIYGTIDMYNQGLKHNANAGEVAFVMKDDIKKRSTGSHIAGEHMGYGTEGTTVRSLTDPHHLIVDRWTSKWKNPRKKDGQRIRAMDAAIDGKTNNDDHQYFEAHMHGGVDLKRDVDHLLVPSSWKSDKAHAKKHESVQKLSKQFGIPIKYEGE